MTMRHDLRDCGCNRSLFHDRHIDYYRNFAWEQEWRRENIPTRKARRFTVQGGEVEEDEFVELGMGEDTKEETLRSALFDLAK